MRTYHVCRIFFIPGGILSRSVAFFGYNFSVILFISSVVTRATSKFSLFVCDTSIVSILGWLLLRSMIYLTPPENPECRSEDHITRWSSKLHSGFSEGDFTSS